MIGQRYTHRDRKMLDLAHGLHECQFRIPGVCKGWAENGCEPAHSNEKRHGKGAGLKSHDVFHAAACHACHHEYDFGTTYSREEKAVMFQSAQERTLLEYLRLGWIAVSK